MTPSPNPSPAARPARKSAEQRSDDILAASAAVFAEQGYRRTDVQHIADRAGVGKGTVYRFFPTKQALFLATVEDSVSRLRATVNEAVAGLADPVERVRTAARAYLGFFDENPGTVELFIAERAEFRDQAKPIYFVTAEAGREAWIVLFEGLAASGRLRAIPAAAAVQTIGDLLYGTVCAHRLSARRQTLLERADEILDAICHGVFADEA